MTPGLKEILKTEKKLNIGNTTARHVIKLIITGDFAWKRYKYIKFLRLYEYHRNDILGIYYLMKKNKMARILNFEIGGQHIGKGLTIYHNGPIVIHGDSIIGENLRLHGDNCIGNNGKTDACPMIGNNVDVGVGAKIIGGIKIADNVTIGAGAVVVKSINEEGCTVVGVPARIIATEIRTK